MAHRLVRYRRERDTYSQPPVPGGTITSDQEHYQVRSPHTDPYCSLDGMRGGQSPPARHHCRQIAVIQRSTTASSFTLPELRSGQSDQCERVREMMTAKTPMLAGCALIIILAAAFTPTEVFSESATTTIHSDSFSRCGTDSLGTYRCRYESDLGSSSTVCKKNFVTDKMVCRTHHE